MGEIYKYPTLRMRKVYTVSVLINDKSRYRYFSALEKAKTFCRQPSANEKRCYSGVNFLILEDTDVDKESCNEQ
jgi:hypothetical protein